MTGRHGIIAATLVPPGAREPAEDAAQNDDAGRGGDTCGTRTPQLPPSPAQAHAPRRMLTPTPQPLLQAALGPGPAPPAAQAVLAAAPLRTLAAGDTLLRAGDRWRHLYAVDSGVLRLYYLDRQGQSSNKNFYLDGALLWPITPRLAQAPVDFWIEAVTPARVWALPWPAWQAAGQDWPAWQALERRVLAALLDDKMQRERQFLQRSASQRYEDLCAQRPDWLARIPLRHLASYLGITDVALSRIRRRLNPG